MVQLRNRATHIEPFLDMLLAFEMIHEIFSVVGPEKKQKTNLSANHFKQYGTSTGYPLFNLTEHGSRDR